MAGYMVYWPKEQVAALRKAKDTGPIRVVLGSVHTKMPSIASVRVGDVIYPVTLEKGRLCVMARLPVEKVESAFDYLLRETGERMSALIPKNTACEENPYNNREEYFFYVMDPVRRYDSAEALPPEITRVERRREPVPHLLHQEPFNCCSQTAASGSRGSTIEPRPVPEEAVPNLRFGPSPSKQKPLKRNDKGQLTSISLAGFTRKMSEETQQVFDSLFEDAREGQ